MKLFSHSYSERPDILSLRSVSGSRPLTWNTTRYAAGGAFNLYGLHSLLYILVPTPSICTGDTSIPHRLMCSYSTYDLG